MCLYVCVEGGEFLGVWADVWIFVYVFVRVSVCV